MRINEILSEDQELDELSLAGIGTGIKNAVGKVGTGLVKGTQTLAKGTGMVAGVPAALKTQYQAGKAATMNKLGTAAAAAAPPSANPAAASGSNPPAAAPPAALPIRTPSIPSNIAAIVSAYELLDTIERQKVHDQLSIADDRARHASGANESVKFSKSSNTPR